MIFKVRLDGESIACSSPRCVQRLLAQGWQLADPTQTDALLEALRREELDETPEGLSASV